LIVAVFLLIFLAVKIIRGAIRLFIILGALALAFWYFTRMT
jgi:hypothetical protein